MRLPTAAEALELIHFVADMKGRSLALGESPWIWAADEFYLLAQRLDLLPEAAEYGGFPYTENGVGLLRSFLQQWQRYLPLPEAPPQCPVKVITGTSAAAALQPVWQELKAKLPLEVVAINNNFLGPLISVAGLLCGSDIRLQLPPPQQVGYRLLVPDVALSLDSGLFVDDLPFTVLQQEYAACGVELTAIPATPQGLLKALYPGTALRAGIRFRRRW